MFLSIFTLGSRDSCAAVFKLRILYEGTAEPLVARNGNLTSMLSCRLRTCKTGFIFCDVF